MSEVVPIVKYGPIFAAIAASETKEFAQTGDMGQSYRARSILLEINGASTPNWALDIQGKFAVDATWHNIDYFRADQGAAVAPSNAQLTVNWTTAQYYVIPNPPPFVRLVGTRTGGTLTVYGAYSTEAYGNAFPVVGLGAGTAAIGKIAGPGDRTPAHTAPTATNATSAMLAAASGRLAALLQNSGSVDVYIKLGAAAVASQGILLQANGGSFAMSDMLGNLDTAAINGITASGSATVLVTEWTA